MIRRVVKPTLLDIHALLEKAGIALGGEWLALEAYFSGVAFGFILAMVLVHFWAKRSAIDTNHMLDLWILMIVMGVFGARILSVIADGHFWDYYNLCADPLLVDWPLTKRQCLEGPYDGMWDPVTRTCHPAYVDCLAWAKFWKGGLTYYGGFLLATGTGLAFLRWRRMPVMRVVDATGWAIPLGLAWGRIGCFFNGCCFGTVTHSAVGVVFPEGSQASRQQWQQGLLESPVMESLPVHPTQLYESAFSIAIAIVCYFVVERHKRFHGQTFLVFVVLYALGRFVEEFFRNDDRGGLLNLSTSQLIGLLTAAVAGGIIAFFFVRARRLESGRYSREP